MAHASHSWTSFNPVTGEFLNESRCSKCPATLSNGLGALVCPIPSQTQPPDVAPAWAIQLQTGLSQLQSELVSQKKFTEKVIVPFARKVTSGRMEVDLAGELINIAGNDYLKMNYPDVLTTRYGNIPELIYVRKCYFDLYNISTEHMLNPSINRPSTLFTGIPGIGKSLFLLYFVFRFINDKRFPDKRFALEFEPQKYSVFYHKVDDMYEVESVDDVVHVSDFLVLSDIKIPVEPGGRTKWLYIFSSPNPFRFKETMKNSPRFTYTMPTWDEKELGCVNPSINDWYGNFITFGGVPRYIFWNKVDDDPRKLLSDALESKGNQIAGSFFKFGHGDVDTNMSFMLVHINPPWNFELCAWEYNGNQIYSFASDFVFQLLQKKYEHSLLSQAINIFDVGTSSATYGGVSAGTFFEKICLWLVPIAEKQIHISFLNESTSCQYQLPKMSYLPDDWKSFSKLEGNVLYQPRISNLESGDAFCAMPDTENPGKWTLIVLQITVGKSHPIKVNGLSAILKSFLPTIQQNLVSKLLVFVTPKHGLLNSVQPLHTVDGKVVTRVSLDISDFQQCVCRYSLSEPFDVKHVESANEKDNMEL